MTLKMKLISGLTGVLMLFLCVALFNLQQVQQIKGQLEQQNQKVELKLMALELKEMVQELNIIASGLEISKKTEYIPTYNEKRKLFDQMIKRIGETADTDEKHVWRSKLILLTGEYTNTFDVAAKLIQERQLAPADLDKNMEYLYNESQRGMGDIFKYVDQFYASYSQDADTAVAVTISKLNRTVSTMIAAFIIVGLCIISTGFILLRSFMRPIQRLQEAVGRIAEGDLRYQINSPAKDELGRLSHSFDHMVLEVRHMLQQTQSIASSLSEHSERSREFSGATAAANREIIRAMQEISEGASQQADYTEQSATIISELAQEIQQMSDYTNAMLSKSHEAALHTHTGSQSMKSLATAVSRTEAVLKEVHTAMTALSESSAKIGHIVGTITDISSQTNVLALNASIEAARAGVHGKGFSVIAEEVRLLSTRTNESSKGIEQLVQSLLSQTKGLEASIAETHHSFHEQHQQMVESVEAFSHIRSSMDELSGQIDGVHQLIAHTEEQNSRLVDSVQHVAGIAQEAAAGVEEVTSSSLQQDAAIHQIAVQSDDMLELAQRLFTEISRFKIGEEGVQSSELQDETSEGSGNGKAKDKEKGNATGTSSRTELESLKAASA
ncbi:methyl-accepting chemotaxis protein [Paenibacillus cremeus]|uniref:Methyl-accepting chemotaxis protein n=1 Tax=Paenibacillus cremeus TaxID=2163881 RepID=A0A559K7K0_9BACL|nr:methyl-accepting chemotaxis protein [Paenibacillus cremeus]TVY08097.1 methyl-accepting chemotaxis protein [Paenibacillus cremeus]